MIGAAIAAAVGLGWHRSLAAAAERDVSRSNASFEPRAGARPPFYAQRAERCDRARQHAIARGRCAPCVRPSRRNVRRASARAKGAR